MKIEHENFVTYGIGVTEAVLDEEEETIDYSQADDEQEEEQDDGFEGADCEFDAWYEGNSFEVDRGYSHGQY